MNWPTKYDIFGVQVSATNYAELVDRLIRAAQTGERAIVDFMPVHGLVESHKDPSFKAMMNQFTVIAPDGQPVRWALNYFHKAGLADRVYGPTTTWKLCEAAEKAGVSIYLYGSTEEVLQQLISKLKASFPNLRIAGHRSPPFRPITPEEDAQFTREINDSGAGLVFLGTGCPRQEKFAFEHRDAINGVQLCVGAAFDFHAGTKKQAPAWMQKRGLEWFFRLTQEPGRLWKRYLVYNSVYCYLFATHAIKRFFSRKSGPVAAATLSPAPTNTQ
jgi:N-acetylglucosaminyldiphosphoundecaprenol N-acetyl-beta-D-mannosaminyltransferase